MGDDGEDRNEVLKAMKEGNSSSLLENSDYTLNRSTPEVVADISRSVSPFEVPESAGIHTVAGLERHGITDHQQVEAPPDKETEQFTSVTIDDQEVAIADTTDDLEAEGYTDQDLTADTNEEQDDLVEATARNPTAVLELDMDCNVRFLSKSWETLVGTKIKKIVHRPVADIVIADSDFDKNVFTRALEIMTVDDLSYRVKFITPTNYNHEASDNESSNSSNEDNDAPDSIHSGISTDGGFIEMEGQGILIHDVKTHLPTHFMWILRPFVPIEVNLELEDALIEKLGSGIDIFESYLVSLNDSGIIDMDAVPAPRHVLCRICEQQVPAWWLERHSEICLVEHKIEDKVRACHDAIAEHKKLILALMEGLSRTLPGSPTMQLAGSPLSTAVSISPSNSVSSMSSGSSASSSSTSLSSRGKPVFEYKGLALPSLKPNTSSLPTTSSPLSSPPSSTPPVRRRSSSILGAMRFPLKNLEKLVQYCTEALAINPGELASKNSQNSLEVAYSPNSERSIQFILNTTLQDSSDPAIHLLTEDTQALAKEKVDAIQRLASSMQYSEKLKSEIDRLVLEAVTKTVGKIREKTTSFDYLRDTQEQSSSIFIDAYMKTDKLPEASDNSGPISRSSTPKIQIGEAKPSPMSAPVESSADTRGRRNFYHQQHKSSYQSPRRLVSPLQPYFLNSPMASLQRNSTRRQRDSGVSLSTPGSSPLLSPDDLPIQSILQKSVNHSNSVSTSDSGISERHSSNEGNFSTPSSKLPLSPLLVSNSNLNKLIVPSIKDYEIIKPISKGAFGSVYLTRRRLTGEYFAIKVLKKSDMIAKNQVPNVKAERAIMMRQADSPYVAQLYSSFQSKDYLFLVMEYLNGGDTASLLKMLGTLSDEWAKRYIAEVIVGVDDLHKKGIVHRDLKPDNLLIDNQGHLKLTDFGLSRMGLIGRQKNVRRDSVADSNSIFDAMQQSNPVQPRHHHRNTSITPFSLSPNLERASLSLPSKSAQDSAASQIPPASPPTPNFFEHLVKNERIRRSSSNASSVDSPLIRPIISRSNSQASFAILDDSELSTPIGESVQNPYALFDPQTSTQARKFVGTPDYLAPETIEGVGQDEVSDWWSIGCILFEFLFGYPPFHASTAEKVFENILQADIDWPDLRDHDFKKICSDEAKDLISKLLVKDPNLRLGVNGTDEIKNHPYFHGISWATLFDEEASFIPLTDDPESTDYFDSRGAEFVNFPVDDDDLGAEIEDEDDDTDYEHDVSDSLDFSNATKISTPHNQTHKVTAANLLFPTNPLSERERRRSSKLSENNSGEFGSFQFRNLAALDRANKDQINRLKNENMEHRGSFSGSSSSTEGLGKSRGHSMSGTTKRPIPVSALNTPSRQSISNSSIYKLGSSYTGSNSGDDNTSTPLLNESSGRNSPLQSGQLSRSTDSGSPVPRIIKPTAKSPSLQFFGLPISPQYSSFKALNQPFQDFSPSSSDNEESRNSAILRVRKRRSSRRLDSASSDTSERSRTSIITYDVLICEPIPILLESTKLMLQRLGCAVVAVKDGDELIRRATGKVKFDFIITALRTPKINAIDVVKLIKHTASVNSDTPIITITAYYREAKNSGVFDYVLEKPINSKVLGDALSRLSIQKRKTTQEAISDTEAVS